MLNSFVFNAAGVAKLAYAADSKSPANHFSIIAKTYRNLPKISFKPTTDADFSPVFRQKMGESYRKLIGDIQATSPAPEIDRQSFTLGNGGRGNRFHCISHRTKGRPHSSHDQKTPAVASDSLTTCGTGTTSQSRGKVGADAESNPDVGDHLPPVWPH